MKSLFFTPSLCCPLSLFAFFLIIFPLAIRAQSLAGHWQGQMNGQGGNLPSTMTLQALGNIVSGTLMFTQNGASETYQVNGQVYGNIAAGTLTFNEQSALTFGMQLNGGQLNLVIGYNGQAILQGQYARGNGNLTKTPPARVQPQAPDLTAQWDRLIRGRRLQYFESNGDLRENKYYDLCSNGSYVYKSVSSSGLSISAGESGMWRIRMQGSTAYLVFNTYNGSIVEKIITPRSQTAVNLDGERYFLDQNRNCQ